MIGLLLSASIVLAGLGPDGMVHEDDTVTVYQELAAKETEAEWHWDRSYGSDDWYIANLIMAEAGNTDKQERQWTGSVPLNRVDSPDFPNTIKEVVEQPDQYATYSDGKFYMMVDGVWTSSDYWEPTEEAWRDAEELLEEQHCEARRPEREPHGMRVALLESFRNQMRAGKGEKQPCRHAGEAVPDPGEHPPVQPVRRDDGKHRGNKTGGDDVEKQHGAEPFGQGIRDGWEL